MRSIVYDTLCDKLDFLEGELTRTENKLEKNENEALNIRCHLKDVQAKIEVLKSEIPK